MNPPEADCGITPGYIMIGLGETELIVTADPQLTVEYESRLVQNRAVPTDCFDTCASMYAMDLTGHSSLIGIWQEILPDDAISKLSMVKPVGFLVMLSSSGKRVHIPPFSTKPSLPAVAVDDRTAAPITAKASA